MSRPALPIAAVVYSPGDPVEALLAAAVRTLKAEGVRVGGLVQHDLHGDPSRICQMELEDVASGERFALSQDLGRGSESCMLDSSALAQAAVAVRRAVEGAADLVVVNKFGTQEVAGGGLRAELGLAAAAGVPLLTAVGQRYLAAWDEFTGGAGTLLPPTPEAILAWWRGLNEPA